MNFPTNPRLQMVGSFYFTIDMCLNNGDPNRRGGPRELDDGRVWSTDASTKRVIRDELERRGHPLYVSRGTDLGDRQEEAGGLRKSDKSTAEDRAAATRRIGEKFIDVRLFGAAITRLGTRPRGPFQFSAGVSLDTANVIPVAITRVAGSRDEEAESDQLHANMGEYKVVEYAVMRADLTFNPFDAQPSAEKPGVSEDDLRAFWEALIDGWEHSRSSRRSAVNPIGLVVFAAASEHLRGGVEPAHMSRARIQVQRNFEKDASPRRLSDYTFSVNRDNLPKGMTVHEWWALG